jgi:hypothetical protein
MSSEPSAIPWRLERHPYGRFDFLDAAGERHGDVDVLRPFPLTDPTGPVAILSHEGAELCWIESLDTLDPETRSIVLEAVDARDFLPEIKTIRSIQGEEPAAWDVETDHGPRQFTTANADAADRTPDGRLVITDTHGIRYLIRDRGQLDFKSRRLLDKNL